MPEQVRSRYIELNRRFRKLEEDSNAEGIALASYTGPFCQTGKSFGWEDLLKQFRVVILGEPGSGKTFEFRERANILLERGDYAFFVRLDQLTSRELLEALGHQEQDYYLKWKNSNSTAYFFLDSVDEAKFRNLSDFYAGLEKFAKGLGNTLLRRAKVYLSSRISEWKPATDMDEFHRLFPVTEEQTRKSGVPSDSPETNNQTPLVVHIDPLHEEQVEVLARAHFPEDVRPFIQAIGKACAWEFARRPLDVLELLAFWKAELRIGSLTELIEFDIATKLRPRDNRFEPSLPEHDALTGAKWLAAANLFCRKFLFLVTDDQSISSDALNPAACLPSNWSGDQIRAILNRALFDSAVYGRFRFHHRRIAEFLAAKWLTDRIENGYPQDRLEELLVENVRGRMVFRPAMRPIAAWLCAGSNRWNSFVRDLVLRVDPEIHLNFGDPAALSLEYRRRILNELAARSKNRKLTWLQTSHDALARFADPALAPEIKAHILNFSLAADFRTEMLELVRHGKITNCLEAALTIITEEEESEALKQYAALAIKTIDDLEIRTQLKALISQMTNIPNLLCASFVESLYPNQLSPTELGSMLEKSQPVRRFKVDLPYYVKSHLESTVSPDAAEAVLKELIRLARYPPYLLQGKETIAISAQFYWIGKIVPTLVSKLLEIPNLSQSGIVTAGSALRVLVEIRKIQNADAGDEDISNLNARSLTQPLVRRAYVWQMVADYRDKHKKHPANSWDIFDWRVLQLMPNDFDWLLKDSREQPIAEDRIIAFGLAIEAWNAARRPVQLQRRLRRIAKRDRKLWSIYRKSESLKFSFSLKRFWYHVRYSRYAKKYWWISKFQLLRSKWWNVRAQSTLFCNLNSLRSGDRVGWLSQLAFEAEQNPGRLSVTSWAQVEEKRGKQIARAAKEGCMVFWRSYSPALPHENNDQKLIRHGVIVGLCGIQAEIDEDTGALSHLSESEVTLAARYAMNELNGFPEWLELLAECHTLPVTRVLNECVRGEWRFPADHENTYKVLRKLSWVGGKFCDIVRPQIIKLFQTGDPANYEIFSAALAILANADHPDLPLLAELAARRVSTASDQQRKVLWLSLWMQADGEAAISYLERQLPGMPDADDLMIDLCSVLSHEDATGGPALKSPSYVEPALLRRFIPLVCAHVRFHEDNIRVGGGVYTPEPRDNAQRFRGLLLDLIAKHQSSSVTLHLRALSEEPALSPVRDWILNLLDERLEQEADFVAWSPSDLRIFAECHEVDPKSARELFTIGLKRLEELKFDVESSNNSLRDEVPSDAKELHLRRWLARKLQERSRNRYNIPQEPEIDLQQRPDLHFVRPGLPPVPVEVKLADLGWSVSELIERLENQLIGQYLRDHRTDYGIYVVGTLGRQRHWKDPQNRRELSFREMIALLSESAGELVHRNPRLGNLAVVGIDFTEPKRE